MPGKQIEEYEIIDTLGEGAAGIAYRARDTRNGNTYALKLLSESVAREPEMQQRFVREVAVLEKLDHPGIVRHHDCGLHEDQIYCVMELVDSGTLAEVLREGGVLPWREAAEVAAQACAALAHAHDRGVVHRDLKPANLFLTSDGFVKIGDFGLARDNQKHRITVEGQTVGTCRYMAPEQVRGEDQLTGAVDLYAMGCLIFLMMTGDCPFNGQTVVQIFEHHLFTPPPRLDKKGIDCPPALAELVDRLLAKDPADRPQDARLVEQALHAILAGEQPELLDETAPEKPNLTQRMRQSAATPPAPQVNTKRLLVVLGIVAAVIAVAVFATR